MEKEIYLSEIPKKFKVEKLGSGRNGTCYLTNDGNVFKEYHTEGIYDDVTKALLRLKYDGFIFPEQLIFVNGIFKGYMRKYIEGVTLSNISILTDIKKLILALKKFEDSLMKLSYDKCLYVYDLNLNNLIYTKENRIYDIDTDNISPFDFPITNPYYENMKELANALASNFMNGKYKNQYLNDLLRECLVIGCSRPSSFMQAAIKEMENDVEIKTISDYKKGLTLIRK